MNFTFHCIEVCFRLYKEFCNLYTNFELTPHSPWTVQPREMSMQTSSFKSPQHYLHLMEKETNLVLQPQLKTPNSGMFSHKTKSFCKFKTLLFCVAFGYLSSFISFNTLIKLEFDFIYPLTPYGLDHNRKMMVSKPLRIIYLKPTNINCI